MLKFPFALQKEKIEEIGNQKGMACNNLAFAVLFICVLLPLPCVEMNKDARLFCWCVCVQRCYLNGFRYTGKCSTQCDLACIKNGYSGKKDSLQYCPNLE